MSPAVALLLTLCFVAYALRRDGRRSEKVSPAVWIPALWMMRCASRPIDFFFLGGSLEDGHLYDQVFLSTLLLAAMVVLIRRRTDALKVAGANLAILVFLGYILVSIAWSPIPYDSGKRALRAFGDVMMGALIATELSPVAALLAMCRRSLIVLIPISIVLGKYFSALGRAEAKHGSPDSWIGVATHKNTLGQLCFVACVILVVHVYASARERKIGWAEIPRRMPLELLYLTLSAFLLFGGAGSTRSSTAFFVTLLAFVVLGCVAVLRGRPHMVPVFLVGFLVCGGLAAVLSELVVGQSLQATVAAFEGKDATLAGRTELWAEVTRRASKQPFLGAGYGGFWTPTLMKELESKPVFSWGPGQAHNGYIETYAQLGAVGVVLLGWMILHALAGSVRSLSRDFLNGQLRLAFLVAILALNFTEAGFPRQNHLMWFLFVVSSMHPVHAEKRAALSNRLLVVRRTGPSRPAIRQGVRHRPATGGRVASEAMALAATRGGRRRR